MLKLGARSWIPMALPQWAGFASVVKAGIPEGIYNPEAKPVAIKPMRKAPIERLPATAIRVRPPPMAERIMVRR
jgi:hypothetical protein